MKQLISSFFVLSFFFFPVFLSQAQTKHEKEKMVEDVLYYVNLHRTGMGLNKLDANPIITSEAIEHSRDMADETISFGHDGFDERMKRIMKQVKPSNAAAENVGEGAKTGKEMVDLWLHSPGHRKNIEGKYNLTGIGIVANNKGVLYFTQIFINKRQL